MQSSLEAGASFISTKDFLPDVLDYCKSKSIPILCAAKSIEESSKACENGANLLKVYPAGQIYEYTFREIVNIKKDYNSCVGIVASGGISRDNIRQYASYGATHFAIGFDLSNMSCSEVDHELGLCDSVLRDIQA